jgi:hypothetical protein
MISYYQKYRLKRLWYQIQYYKENEKKMKNIPTIIMEKKLLQR